MSHRLRSLVVAAALAGGGPALRAEPALTVIQDTIYKADGTRFRGVAVVEWKTFTTATGANIGMQTTVVPIVDGVLRVRLAPTTNVSGGAYYLVRYNSDGKIQFTEYWTVPPSATTLRLADVRSSSPGQSSIPGSSTGPMQITDIIGLANELSLRPGKSAGFTSGRAVIVNAEGLLESASGDADDCLRVDGTSGPCSSNGGDFVDQEVLTGALDGVNTVFTLASAPSPTSSLTVFRNGIRLAQTLDYTLSGTSITFVASGIPQPGDVLIASYRTGGGAGGQQVAGPVATLPGPQVVCSAAGGSTAAGVPQTLGTCLIPTGLILPGDRFEIRADWSHTGSQGGFSATISWGSTAILNRTAAAVETVLAGRSEVSYGGGGGQWSTTSWGEASPSLAAAGTATDNITQGLLITLSAATASAGSDAVRLRSYTVVRYRSLSTP